MEGGVPRPTSSINEPHRAHKSESPSVREIHKLDCIGVAHVWKQRCVSPRRVSATWCVSTHYGCVRNELLAYETLPQSQNCVSEFRLGASDRYPASTATTSDGWALASSPRHSTALGSTFPTSRSSAPMIEPILRRFCKRTSSVQTPAPHQLGHRPVRR